MRKRHNYGFVRVAAAVPIVKVGDCKFNAARHKELIARARKQGVKVLVFPELSLTSYTCGDLFQNDELQEGAVDALLEVAAATVDFPGLVFVGLPLAIDDQLFNCAAALHRGKILGIVPKSFIPNYKEFYELRWFSPAHDARSKKIQIGDQMVPFGAHLLFQATDVPGLIVGAEICEDVWVPIPPSSWQAINGATIIVNLSASNELIGKADYRRQLVGNQSGRCIVGYIYVSCGTGESTTDVVFGGHAIIAVNGGIEEESQRFSDDDQLIMSDIDLHKLRVDRMRTNSFADCPAKQGGPKFVRIPFEIEEPAPAKLLKKIDGHPFIPKDPAKLRIRCEEMFNIQVGGLTKRLQKIGCPNVWIGVSGGLDSTAALLVACRTMDRLKQPRTKIQGVTMPGFGTTERTKNNAIDLMAQLGVTAHEVDIRKMCLEQMREQGHKPFGIDLTGLTVEQFEELLRDLPDDAKDLQFENTQARMRTKILMDSGFVIGTGDLSELALGWCTFNGDHASMYNVNCSIPKTLMKFVLAWTAYNLFTGAVQATLLDIVGTDISPELLPVGRDGKVKQKTESSIGPYELHDFFLYYMIRYGASPEKILYLAQQAEFNETYSGTELRKWLKLFLVRFFNSQFKRSFATDGPKVGSISLSPRGDWRMPSDAEVTLWVEWANEADPATATTTPQGGNMSDTTTAAKRKRALGLVDAVNDFGSATHNNGAGLSAQLPVPEGEQIGEPIGRLQDEGDYDVTFAGNDDHQPDMFNFASQNPDKKPYVDQVPDRDGELWTVWPDHCIHGSWGADFLPGVRREKITRIFPKGTARDKDSFAATGNEELIPWLRENGITDVDLTGLVFRICVGKTAVALAKEGFKVRVVVDATRDLDVPAFAEVIQQMKDLEVEFVTVDQVLAEKK